MASGRWTTHRASSAALVGALMWLPAAMASSQPPAVCNKPVYLTVDTGHMGVADLFADVLQRHQVKVTFFLANEATLTGGTSLDTQWAPWWRARAAEGHAFASHTWDHGYWRADLSGQQFRIRQTFGPKANQTETWTAQRYCDELQRPAQRLKAMAAVGTCLAFAAGLRWSDFHTELVWRATDRGPHPSDGLMASVSVRGDAAREGVRQHERPWLQGV